ncbi:MAG: cytochrome c3 family protein [Deltaproteobacteria bacterium]|nr:cytochrome c3 family protein [Deltaproteobacteria bacterium]
MHRLARLTAAARRMRGATLIALISAATAAHAEDKISPPKWSLAPVAGTVGWSHAPFEAGACDTCHSVKKPKGPGSARQPVSTTCLVCHDELQQELAKSQHKHAALEPCTNCHNPHNGADRSLLVGKLADVCAGCHRQACTKKHPERADPKLSPALCLGCHDPHASQRDHLRLDKPKPQPESKP